MKKLGTLLLAGVLAAGLALPAFAAEDGADTVTIPVSELEIMPADLVETSLSGENDLPLLIAPNPYARTGEGYAMTLVVNGVEADTSALPAADGIPLRLLAESDHGSAYWAEEEATGYGYLEGATVGVNVDTGAISLDFEPVEGVQGVEVGGFTFVPVEFINSLEGYAVTVNGDRLEVTTPNNDPMIQMAYEVLDASQCGGRGRTELDYFMEGFDVSMDNFECGWQFVGFSNSPDALIVAKLAEGADEAAIRAAMDV